MHTMTLVSFLDTVYSKEKDEGNLIYYMEVKKKREG